MEYSVNMEGEKALENEIHDLVGGDYLSRS
jgi:hypothetical protein